MINSKDDRIIKETNTKVTDSDKQEHQAGRGDTTVQAEQSIAGFPKRNSTRVRS